MEKPVFVATTPGTLREQVLQYSQDRMKRDKKYKREVVKSLVEKRRKKNTKRQSGEVK